MSRTLLSCVSYMNHLRFVNECFMLYVFQRVQLWKRWGRVGVHDLLYALHLHIHITTPTHRIRVSLRARGEQMGVIRVTVSHTTCTYTHTHIYAHIRVGYTCREGGDCDMMMPESVWTMGDCPILVSTWIHRVNTYAQLVYVCREGGGGSCNDIVSRMNASGHTYEWVSQLLGRCIKEVPLSHTKNFCHTSLALSESKKKGHNRLFCSFRIDAKIRKVKNS